MEVEIIGVLAITVRLSEVTKHLTDMFARSRSVHDMRVICRSADRLVCCPRSLPELTEQISAVLLVIRFVRYGTSRKAFVD